MQEKTWRSAKDIKLIPVIGYWFLVNSLKQNAIYRETKNQ